MMLDLQDIGFSEEELRALAENIDSLDPDEAAEVEAMLEELETRLVRERAKDDLIAFCQYMNPDYKVGRHHRILADKLMALEVGEKDRATVNMPPRHGKSQLVSIYFPAWFIGRNPTKKVMMVSHTTDLAVDFGRKVRNLIDETRFQDIFPGITLSADSKSAGRWSTNHGGEYFACIRPETKVTTLRGHLRADAVLPGDHLLSTRGFVPVYSTMRTSHDTTVHIAGTGYSVEHPIWTMNRGWVEAANISQYDVLCSESISDKLWATVRRFADGPVEHPDVSSLVQHKKPLHEPEEREVPRLRGARDYARPALGLISALLRRYGRPAVIGAHSWSDRQQRPIQPRELSLGDRGAATEQQTYLGADRSPYAGATCATVGVDSRGVAVSDVSWARCAEPEEGPQGEPNYPSAPANFGWLRRAATRLLTSRSTGVGPAKPQTHITGYLARMPETAQKLCGLLLGVRYAGNVTKEDHAPREFVNFRVGGDNTFFADGVLTHNCGVGSSLAGRGADMLIVDDPHSEQDVLNGNFEVFDKAYQWFTYGARTRLMPGGRVAVVATRWHLDDLTGRLVRDMAQNEGADQYDVVEFPAILESKDEHGAIKESPLWPEFFDLEALHRTRASMPVFQWNAQYQQNPTAESAALVKREWWRTWAETSPPEVDYVIMSLDTATEAKQRADYTALTVWGVFFNEDEHGNHLILLDSIRRRVEYPELKKLAVEQYRHWKPDAFIVEKKNSGVAIFQELRRTGMLLQEYMPTRASGNKYARLQSVADIVASGIVWVPQTRWAEELVEEIAAFPVGSHDDLVDSTVIALMRFREGGFLRLPSDDQENDEDTYVPYKAAYY